MLSGKRATPYGLEITPDSKIHSIAITPAESNGAIGQGGTLYILGLFYRLAVQRKLHLPNKSSDPNPFPPCNLANRRLQSPSEAPRAAPFPKIAYNVNYENGCVWRRYF